MATVASYSSEAAAQATRPATSYAADGGVDLRLPDLDQEVAAGRQPVRGRRGDPAQRVEPVRPTVERGPGLVLAGLGRHQRDRLGRDVRRVRDQQVDPPPQGRRATAREVADVRPAGPRARFNRAHATAAGSTSTACTSTDGTSDARAAPIAPMPQHRSTTTVGRGHSDKRLLDQEAGPGARHEHAGRHREPEPAELRPPQHVLQRLARHPPLGQPEPAPRR